MSFSDLYIPASLNSSNHDLTLDFFQPLLKEAITYNRGVGYFSSGWLRINSQGLTSFAENQGKARWITSPILSEGDWEALKKGSEAVNDDMLRTSLKNNIDNLSESLEKDTLSALAWMVADGILEFKLAVLRGKLDGEFHDKFGTFTDKEGNIISFSGSYNESINGTHNYESFKVFKSWVPEQEDWVKGDVERFENLWNNKDPNVRTLDIGQSNKEQIIKLRKYDRPYSHKAEKPESANSPIPNNISLRNYQKKAIDEWFKNYCQGFFEMATGTGKTFTALAATKMLQAREDKLAVIIAVPYQHLVEQWNEEAKKFGISSILAYKSKSNWINRLNSQIVEFNNGFRKFLSVIVTHTTFCTGDFQASIGRINSHGLVIADEAHHLGTETAQQAYPETINYRLALSATPNRWYDEHGTEALRNYFGRTVFEFPLSQAIGVSLTPYNYYPVLVELTEAERDEYSSYTTRIAKLYGNPDPQVQERVKHLLRQRANILNKAENKLNTLGSLLDENPVEKHTLFYCAPGQIDDVMRLAGNEKGIFVHPFTAQEDNRLRQDLLKDFASGQLQALAAIRCLDEGVDVPHTETAYLMASSTNPREFIQRRGRILRKAPGKKYSYLYDLITVPPNTANGEDRLIFELDRSILKRELNRFKEFADNARNKHEAIDVIWRLAERYELMDF